MDAMTTSPEEKPKCVDGHLVAGMNPIFLHVSGWDIDQIKKSNNF